MSSGHMDQCRRDDCDATRTWQKGTVSITAVHVFLFRLIPSLNICNENGAYFEVKRKIATLLIPISVYKSAIR